jgi:predicted RNA binding protein YcfA (HicA-like mRNA interferase family)
METSRQKVLARLLREGWTDEGGAKHDRFKHLDRPNAFVIVPRHRTLSPGVARSIARAAGWSETE